MMWYPSQRTLRQQTPHGCRGQPRLSVADECMSTSHPPPRAVRRNSGAVQCTRGHTTGARVGARDGATLGAAVPVAARASATPRARAALGEGTALGDLTAGQRFAFTQNGSISSVPSGHSQRATQNNPHEGCGLSHVGVQRRAQRLKMRPPAQDSQRGSTSPLGPPAVLQPIPPPS